MEHTPNSEDETIQLPSSSLEQQLIEKPQRSFLGIKLKPEVPPSAFVCFLINNFQITQSLTLLATAGTSIIVSPQYYGLSTLKAGSVVGNLNFFVELYQVCIQFFVGPCHDLFGRRTVFLSGFALLTVSLILQPYMPSIFPWLLIVRIVSAQGITHLLVNPLVNDYVQHETKGLATALGGLVGGAGAVFTMLGLSYLGTLMPLEGLFIISSCISLFGLAYSFIFLKNHFRPATKSQIQITLCRRFLNQLKSLKFAVKSNPIIPLAFIGTFVLKCLDVTLTVYLTLYITAFSDSQQRAQRKGAFILGLSSVIGVSISLLFGKLLDKIPFYKLLVPSFLAIGTGYIAVPFLPNPSHFITSLVLIVSSAMVIGSTVIVTVMIIKAIKDEARGTIMSAYVLFGSMGVLVMTKTGGEIFQKVAPSSPFLLCGALALLYGLGIGLFVIIRRPLSDH